MVYLLPRWFNVPSRVFLAGRYLSLALPEEDDLDADFIECFLRNCYGLGRGLGKVRTILDIGAHAGFFAMAARAHYPEAIIHSYEPNPRIFPILASNGSAVNVRVFAEAVGAREGSVTVVDTGPSDEARILKCHGENQSIRQVPLETAVRRIGGTVDLLKLNCEGAEWEILSPCDFWPLVRNIRMEYHLYDGGSVEEMMSKIAELGFRVSRVDPHHRQAGVIWANRTS